MRTKIFIAVGVVAAAVAALFVFGVVGGSNTPEAERAVAFFRLDSVEGGENSEEFTGELVVADAESGDQTPIDPRGSSPVLSPDGDRIAFMRGDWTVQDAIVIADTDGDNEVVIEAGGGDTSSDPLFSFSADGERLLYTHAPEGDDGREQEEVVVVGVDGSGRTVIGAGQMPSFSPDGERVVFVRETDEQVPIPDAIEGVTTAGEELVVVNIDGEGEETVLDSGISIAIPSFSPDGSRIAYAIGGNVTVIGTDGEDKVDLGKGTMPVFTPDSEHVAFTRIEDDGENPAVILAPVGGDEETRLGDGHLGAVSPVGERIAMTGNEGMVIVDYKGAEIASFDSDQFITSPAFSADGELISFIGWKPEGENDVADLIVANTEGGGERVIGQTVSAGIGAGPAFAPAGYSTFQALPFYLYLGM